ncbi:MAG TPA: PIN domain-containing protein [Gammaproteobacteria bacterium]|nr:PIN domain-containing protein [Gammaproteobacteria bacterium]
MTQKLLLIDFENVQQVDLGRLDDACDVMIFVGASQKNVPIDLVTAAQKLGARVEWKRVEGNGKNALDFFIAFELGRIAERGGAPQCIILSRDRGFDPLLRHLNKNGLRCRRINSMLELEPRTDGQGDDPNYNRAVEVLGKQEKKSRPRRRKTLSQHIASMFQNKLAQPEVDRIVDLLFANKLVSEMNGAITYEFD